MERSYYEHESDAEVPVLFNRSVRAIDSYLRETRGSGILDLYGGPEKTSQISVFGRIPYYGEREYRITYRDATADSMVVSFLAGVYRCCVSVVCKENGEKGPAVPSMIGKDIRAIIASVHAKGCMSMPRDDPAKHIKASPLKASDGPGFLIIPKGGEHHDVSSRFRSDMPEYVAKKDSGPAPYVDAPYYTPEYSSLSEEQMSFYLYWRSEARRGVYITTHIGYVWMHLCELINDRESDPAAVYRSLEGLCAAYELDVVRDDCYDWCMSHYAHIIGRTCVDYAIVNDLDLPSDSLYPSRITADAALEAILHGDDATLSREGVSAISIATKAMEKEVDDDVARIFCRALHDINSRSKSRDGVVSYCRMRRTTLKVKVYNELKYFYWPNKKPVQYPRSIYDFFSSRSFTSECRELLKCVAKAVKSRRSGKKVDNSHFLLFGVSYDGLPGIVEEHFSSKAAAPKAKRDVELNKDAIDAAQENLRRTTEMMSVEEAEDAFSCDAPAGKPPEDDLPKGWDSFVGSLSENQKEVLVAMMEDPEGASKKRTRVSTINSINLR